MKQFEELSPEGKRKRDYRARKVAGPTYWDGPRPQPKPRPMPFDNLSSEGKRKRLYRAHKQALTVLNAEIKTAETFAWGSGDGVSKLHLWSSRSWPATEDSSLSLCGFATCGDEGVDYGAAGDHCKHCLKIERLARCIAE